MATSSEQLAATGRSLEDSPPGGGSDDSGVEDPLRALGSANSALRSLLQRLRDELGLLFTTGESDGLQSVLDGLAALPASRGAALQESTAAVPMWTQRCRAPGAVSRYDHFEVLRAEHRQLESELEGLGEELYALREQRAAADGTLAGLEERLGQRRDRRRGEEYEMARYLGASLFRWELLRTKVAHHLAHTFSEAREAALRAASAADTEGAERRLSVLEEQLLNKAGAHRRLSERRGQLGKQLRAFLKSLLLSCEAAPEEAPPDPAMSRRFKMLRGNRLGVRVQAAEEFARFLNGTFVRALPRTVALLQEVLAPYAAIRGDYVLPKTWKARPRIGRWWEWLQGGSTAGNRPVGREEFERRFAAAKRRFSVRVSAAEPVVMAYLLWLLLEDILGAAASDGGRQEVLTLPSPADVMPTAAIGSTGGAVAAAGGAAGGTMV